MESNHIKRQRWGEGRASCYTTYIGLEEETRDGGKEVPWAPSETSLMCGVSRPTASVSQPVCQEPWMSRIRRSFFFFPFFLPLSNQGGTPSWLPDLWELVQAGDFFRTRTGEGTGRKGTRSNLAVWRGKEPPGSPCRFLHASPCLLHVLPYRLRRLHIPFHCRPCPIKVALAAKNGTQIKLVSLSLILCSRYSLLPVVRFGRPAANGAIHKARCCSHNLPFFFSLSFFPCYPLSHKQHAHTPSLPYVPFFSLGHSILMMRWTYIEDPFS